MINPKIDPVPLLGRMARNRIENYIIPGLASSLIGGEGKGTVRLFECSRAHEENITPHSHRFDFQCLVLAGTVTNVIWSLAPDHLDDGDYFAGSVLRYGGTPGEYQRCPGDVARYVSTPTTHEAGDWYGMRHNEIHSIFFSRGAKVLFFEGPQISNETLILEPWVNGTRVPTFEVKPWMFTTAAPS